MEHTLGLPGGVTVSSQSSGGALIWSHPSIHGDTIVTTDQNRVRKGTLAQYDPFGQPIDPVTNCIGTNNADDAVPIDTLTPGAGYGPEGSHQKLYQHVGDISVSEMGARQYAATLGRLLSVDPITGGNVNDDIYPADPVNASDLTGARSWHRMGHKSYVRARVRSCGRYAGKGVNMNGGGASRAVRDATSDQLSAIWGGIGTAASLGSILNPLLEPVAIGASLMAVTADCVVRSNGIHTMACYVSIALLGLSLAPGVRGIAAISGETGQFISRGVATFSVIGSAPWNVYSWKRVLFG